MVTRYCDGMVTMLESSSYHLNTGYLMEEVDLWNEEGNGYKT
jgi:hypothetical protein